MSEEKLSALPAKLKDDAGLREKTQKTEDLDAAVELAKESDFDVREKESLNDQTALTPR